jgi:hypothetical protein
MQYFLKLFVRTSQNSVMAKFAEFLFHALGGIEQQRRVGLGETDEQLEKGEGAQEKCRKKMPTTSKIVANL